MKRKNCCHILIDFKINKVRISSWFLAVLIWAAFKLQCNFVNLFFQLYAVIKWSIHFMTLYQVNYLASKITRAISVQKIVIGRSFTICPYFTIFNPLKYSDGLVYFISFSSILMGLLNSTLSVLLNIFYQKNYKVLILWNCNNTVFPNTEKKRKEWKVGYFLLS